MRWELFVLLVQQPATILRYLNWLKHRIGYCLMLQNFFVPTIENGEELCIRVCFGFFFTFYFFPRKISYQNNHRNVSSDISY